MGLLPSFITDTGNQDAIDDDPLSPEEMAAEAMDPASVGWVKRYYAQRARLCPAVRKVRVFSLWGSFAVGAFAVFNVVALFSLRSIVRETVREVVREELNIRGLRARGELSMSPRTSTTPTAGSVPLITGGWSTFISSAHAAQ